MHYELCIKCIYNRIPEEELSSSKHVEEIKNVHFVGLSCIIILKCKVQEAFKKCFRNLKRSSQGVGDIWWYGKVNT